MTHRKIGTARCHRGPLTWIEALAVAWCRALSSTTPAAIAKLASQLAGGLLPQRRMGEPKDGANAVRSIADGRLDYCTAQVLHGDGGFHLRTL